MENIFLELTIILTSAGVIAYLARFLKQPTIIAYILTGLVISLPGIYNIHHREIWHSLAEIGITLLLFMVGLDLDLSQLKRIGKAAIIAGIGQVLFTMLIGFGIIKMLGVDNMAAWYIAIALTFSSTIIVVKLLSEKKDLQSLYGKLAIGIFLIQDVAAIFILIFLAGLTGSADNKPIWDQWSNHSHSHQSLFSRYCCSLAH
jgi:Kef-type K+ transport system membrane component KefB